MIWSPAATPIEWPRKHLTASHRPLFNSKAARQFEVKICVTATKPCSRIVRTGTHVPVLMKRLRSDSSPSSARALAIASRYCYVVADPGDAIRFFESIRINKHVPVYGVA